ncbi:MAG TPA: LptF/LptG family permease, partial [Candidatus Sumerlaeota bacterium]|nr:LptF/LptG family permease [Candidatus Sumerlaeota bacterium]
MALPRGAPHGKDLPSLAWILRRYSIREVALPTVMALLLLTFVFIIGSIRDLIDLVLHPGVTVGQVLVVLASFLPATVLFVVPMAVLIGVLIGVGRMTLDREVLAMRASGINLFSIFAPMLALAVVLAGVVFWLGAGPVPRMFLRGMERVADMRFALISSLGPGQFHEIEGDDNMALFFRERDPQTQAMKGVVLKMQKNFEGSDLRKKLESLQVSGELKRAVLRVRGGKLELEKPQASDEETTETTRAAAAADATSVSLTPVLKAGADATPDAERRDAPADAADDEGPEPIFREGSVPIAENEITYIFAETGGIRTGFRRDGRRDRNAAILLSLRNGSYHRLSPDPLKPEYVSGRFGRLEKLLFTDTEIDQENKTRTNPELVAYYKDRKNDLDDRRKAYKEYIRRFVFPAACFVFALIGVPISIWVRPSGKSWGILLAIGLMLIYYVLMQWGLSMVEDGKQLGLAMSIFPVALFSVL